MNHTTSGTAGAVTVTAPPSKSLTHRYLIGAGLAHGTSVLRHTLVSEDAMATRGILETLGARIRPLDGSGDLTVEGTGGAVRGGEGSPLSCDVGESGTTCRLLCAVLATGTGLFRIAGRGRMHERPVDELCEALTSLGAGVTYLEKKGCPPVLLQACGLDPDLAGSDVTLGMDSSSQYFSGLLLAAPLCAKPLTVTLGGHKAVSWPYVGLTLQCLTDFGIPFSVETRPEQNAPWRTLPEGGWRETALAVPGCLRITVHPAPYRPGDFAIEGDWSGASYFLAAGALGKRPVTVRGLREDSLQGDRLLLDILQKMGAEIRFDDDSVTVFPSALHGVDLDMGSCPDLVPTVAILAAWAHGSTRIRNVAHLRIKETDRIAAPAQELGRVGVTVDMLTDGMLVNGKGGAVHLKPGQSTVPALAEGDRFCAHNDHRIAMSLALLELLNPELHVRERIDAPQVVAKSFPDFWERWACLL
ncbi:MAG: 3-phosphoshikimate 1-carboxyvinyltransferase [Desulfovibrio sp.]|nr:3-phosphoshikimate 1-carboxyvinyltransferase [Desulfovibrio sp.]